MARNYFTARWASKCYSCGEPIEPNDKTFFLGGRDSVHGVACCGERADHELVVPMLSNAYSEAFGLVPNDDFTEQDDFRLNRRLVMPRGKSASDMCKKCFQIPSSNGVCGCVG